METESHETEVMADEHEADAEDKEVTNLPATTTNGLATDLGPVMTASSVGWQLPLDIGVKDWKENAKRAGIFGDARQFIVGDLMVAGRKNVKDKRYQLLDEMGITRDSADRWEWVCGAIPMEHRVRRPLATFEHHATLAGLKEGCPTHTAKPDADCADCEVARLDAVDFWLGKVARSKGSMTVADLKTAMQEHYAPRDAAPKAKAKVGRKKKATENETTGDVDEGEHAEPEPEVFDPERLLSAAKVMKHQMQHNLRPRLANLVTKKGRPDRRRIEAMFKAANDVREAVAELIKAGNEAIDSLDALAP